jgi:hypothetical protein
MNILRSKYVNNPVVAAMIIVGAAFIMAALNERQSSGFPDAETRTIRTFCDAVGFPLGLIEWAGWDVHPKSHALRIANMVIAVVIPVGTWTIIICGMRGLVRRIRRHDG